MDGFTFSVPVRVRFADTDAQGVAHNSAYVVWFEVARVEYLRTYAGGYQALPKALKMKPDEVIQVLLGSQHAGIIPLAPR